MSRKSKRSKSRKIVSELDYARVAESMRNKARKLSVNSDEFLSSFEWRKVRMLALKKYGPVCQCCGASPRDGAVMNVEHIKPRRLFPQLALDVQNLQILCHECNHGKGSWDMTDWRTTETDHVTDLDIDAQRHIRSI